MLSPDKMVAVETLTGFLDSEPSRDFRWGWRRDLGSASLPPSFLSSSPATVRSARTGAVKEKKRQGGAARSRPRRGHGLARLDGTRQRATVADKVMKSGQTVGQATAAEGADPTQAQRAAP